MYRILLRCALSICVSMLLVQPALAMKPNLPAPDFTLKRLDGRKVTLAEQRGKAVILNFWSTTCPPCVAEMPGLNALYRELKANGLLVLGIALDPAEGPVRELVARQRIEYPILMDSAKDVYFDAYGLFGQPVSILIDRAGVVREKLVGQVEWTSPALRAKVQNIMKGR